MLPAVYQDGCFRIPNNPVSFDRFILNVLEKRVAFAKNPARKDAQR
jgi:hypothetical protein